MVERRELARPEVRVLDAVARDRVEHVRLAKLLVELVDVLRRWAKKDSKGTEENAS